MGNARTIAATVHHDVMRALLMMSSLRLTSRCCNHTLSPQENTSLWLRLQLCIVWTCSMCCSHCCLPTMSAMTLPCVTRRSAEPRIATHLLLPFARSLMLTTSLADFASGDMYLRRRQQYNFPHGCKLEIDSTCARRVIQLQTRLFSLQKYSLVKAEPRHQLFGANKRASAGLGGKVAAAVRLTVVFAPRRVVPLHPNPALFRLGVSNGPDVFNVCSVAFNVSHLENVKTCVLSEGGRGRGTTDSMHSSSATWCAASSSSLDIGLLTRQALAPARPFLWGHVAAGDDRHTARGRTEVARFRD